MKKFYKSVFGLLFLGFISAQSFAANHIISVQNFAFNPGNLNVLVGDSVTWLWLDGFHTTTSDVIPVGAAVWDSPIESGSPMYSYVVSVAGTYNYHCTIHLSMGMTGSFVATGSTDILQYNAANLGFIVFQNSSDKALCVKFDRDILDPATINLMDLSGRIVFVDNAISVEKGTIYKMYPGILPQGVYLAELRVGVLREVRRIVLN